MQIRKKGNLTKPSHPRGGWAEWRSAKGAPAIQRRPKKGESGYHRLRRIVDATPGCGVCGTHNGLVSYTRNGKTEYRCPEHIGVAKTSKSQSYDPQATKGRSRVNMSERPRNVSDS